VLQRNTIKTPGPRYIRCLLNETATFIFECILVSGKIVQALLAVKRRLQHFFTSTKMLRTCCFVMWKVPWLVSQS